MAEPDETGRAAVIDLPTVVAISVIAFAVSNIVHEGLGHGGACLLVGGTPKALTSMTFDCDIGAEVGWNRRFLAAGGTLSNLGAAAVLLGLLGLKQKGGPHARYFLWLCGTVNALQGTGYFLFSGVAGVGDWAVYFEGLGPSGAWRLALTLLGAATYFLSVRLALVQLGPFIGVHGDARRRRASTLMLVPFFVGATLYVGAGLLHPDGGALLAMSAAASSLGGTSGLAWGPQLLRGEEIAGGAGAVAPLARNWRWLAAGAAAAVAFVTVLGPGVALD